MKKKKRLHPKHIHKMRLIKYYVNDCMNWHLMCSTPLNMIMCWLPTRIFFFPVEGCEPPVITWRIWAAAQKARLSSDTISKTNLTWITFSTIFCVIAVRDWHSATLLVSLVSSQKHEWHQEGVTFLQVPSRMELGNPKTLYNLSLFQPKKLCSNFSILLKIFHMTPD